MTVASTSPFPERLEVAGVAVLDRWRPGDELLLGDLIAQSLEHLRPYMDFAREEPGPPEAHAELLEGWEEDWRGGRGAFYQVLDDEGAPCGAVSIYPRFVANVLHVGYWLAPWGTGRGRITRAVAVLTEVALQRDGVDAVAVRHDAANVRSGKVPERLGFERCRAQSHVAHLPGAAGITVQWEARRGWRPPPRYSANSPTGHDTPVPPNPQ